MRYTSFMQFVSFTFLAFLLVVFVLFLIVKSKKVRMPLLLLANLVFYAFGGSWIGLLIFVGTMALFYGFALLIARHKRKWLLCISILVSLAPLILCKYIPYYLSLFGASNNAFATIGIPLGISFFTLQGISYLVDVYRDEVTAEKNPLYVGIYLSLFSVVTSGPFCSASSIFSQLKEPHPFDYDESADGFRKMAIGLFLKLLIAENLGAVVNTFYNAPNTEHYGLMLLVSTIFFAFQLYADFYGYSLMAQGSAKTIGIQLPDNFHQPYLSSSISSFWGRWHMSFQKWLQKYIYIPLGGSHVKLWRVLVNVLIVFLVSGLWHGSGVTFLIWGGLNGIYVCLERLLKLNSKNKRGAAKVIGLIYTFVLICVSWIFFRANSLADALTIFRQIFVGIPTDLIAIIRHQLSISALFPHAISFLVSFLLSIIGIACMIALDVVERRRGQLSLLCVKWNVVARWAFYIGIVAIAVGFGVWGGVSEFMYAQF